MKRRSQKTAGGCTVRKVEGPRSTEIEQLAEDYLSHCRAAGLSPKTIRHAYGYPLRAVFLPWCVEQGIERPSDLTTRRLDLRQGSQALPRLGKGRGRGGRCRGQAASAAQEAGRDADLGGGQANGGDGQQRARRPDRARACG
jgi:hypothetical protein